jgi:DNA invertase Pin-like site-specific DNA recombinase
MIRERTLAGLEAARLRGKKGGRPAGLSKSAQGKAHSSELLYKEEKLSVAEICMQLDLSKATFYKYLKLRGVSISADNYIARYKPPTSIIIDRDKE